MKVKAFYKRELDPLATRISCGSFKEEAYIIYRGKLKDVKKTIEVINNFLQKQTEEAETDPRDLYENNSN